MSCGGFCPWSVRQPPCSDGRRGNGRREAGVKRDMRDERGEANWPMHFCTRIVKPNSERHD